MFVGSIVRKRGFSGAAGGDCVGGAEPKPHRVVSRRGSAGRPGGRSDPRRLAWRHGRDSRGERHRAHGRTHRGCRRPEPAGAALGGGHRRGWRRPARCRSGCRPGACGRQRFLPARPRPGVQRAALGRSRSAACRGRACGRPSISAASAVPTSRMAATTSPRSRRTCGALIPPRFGFDRPVLVGHRSAAAWCSIARPPSEPDPRPRPGGRRSDGPADAFPTWKVCWRVLPASARRSPLSDVEGYSPEPRGLARRGRRGLAGELRDPADRTFAPWLTRDHHRAILGSMSGQRTADLWRRAGSAGPGHPGRRR